MLGALRAIGQIDLMDLSSLALAPTRYHFLPHRGSHEM
jgi:hypothetical protein